MKRLLITLTIGLTAVATYAADNADPIVNRLMLRAEVAVSGSTLRLADVLVLTDADPQIIGQIGDAPVTSKPGTQLTTSISHEQVVRRLDELGVNLSRVLVSGALQCRIARPSAPDGASADDGEGALVHAPAKIDGSGEKTLAEVLQAHVAKELAGLGGTPEITFERAGQEFLRLTTPPWQFSVSSTGRDKLGLREFHVVIRGDGQMQRKVEVSGAVHLVQPVVVAVRPLSIGNYVRREDVSLETRVFEQDTSLGIGDVEAVVGQQVKRFIPAGELVLAEALKPVDMVVRSRPVTVTNTGGSVQMRLSGVALDSAGYGESVRVRVGDAKRDKQVLRGVVTGVGTVRLVESVQ